MERAVVLFVAIALLSFTTGEGAKRSIKEK